MTVKNLLNFIAIEVEAGRLSEDAELCAYNEAEGRHSEVTSVDVDHGGLDFNFSELYNL